MSVTRRDFLKLTGVVAAGAVSVGALPLLTGCSPASKTMKGSRKKITICPFCSLGCGLRLYIKKGAIIYVDGDPDHPVNRGTLCPKASLLAGGLSAARLTYVKYRKPGASGWESLSIDRALDMIAERFAATRDATFVQDDSGVVVNRVESIAGIAGSSLTNEEAYLFNKLMRLAGVVNVGTESLVRSSGFASGMLASFGLPSQTNPWTDAVNADLVLMLGTNPARSVPVVMKHVEAVRAHGGKLIVVDPAVTETCSVSDLHCQIRPGTDTAFLLGLIRQAFVTGAIAHDYVVEYTDAACILRMDFDYDVKTSRFSGYDAAKKIYSASTWEYERDERGNAKRDEELRNSRTVYQTLKRLADRYTVSYVCNVTGLSTDVFLRASELYLDGVKNGRSAAVVIGSGIEGHRAAAQTVRAVALLQMLTGNIGVSGGGIFTTTGGANSRGVDDQIPSWDLLPGGLPLPKNYDAIKEIDLASYIKNNTPVSNDAMSINTRQYFKNYSTSLLKAWFGDQATRESRYCFDLLPKTAKEGTTESLFSDLASGKIKGLLQLGGSISLPAAQRTEILSRLDWLVVSDIWNSDTAEFWNGKGSAQIKTEVFLLPDGALFEKNGTVTNSSRWAVRSDAAAVNNRVTTDLSVIDGLFKRLRSRYHGTGVFPEPFQKATWNYGDADETAVSREICGVSLSNGKALASMRDMASDGTTLCGNLLYCGMNKGDKASRRHDGGRTDLYARWGWAAPSNVRVLYNRAGVDRKGKPWNPARVIVDTEKNRSSLDVTHGEGSAYDKNPFVMNRDGLALLFTPSVSDGPFPDHEEPSASAFPFGRSSHGSGKSGTIAVFSGLEMISVWENIPDAAELFSDDCCEVSRSLASAKGIESGDRITVSSGRGDGLFTAVVTSRLRPLVCDGTPVDIVRLCGRSVMNILPAFGSGGDIQYLPVEIKSVQKRGSR